MGNRMPPPPATAASEGDESSATEPSATTSTTSGDELAVSPTDADESVLAMTTPFSMPSACLDFNHGTALTFDHFGTSTVMFQDTTLLQRASCWPDGIFNATYSPAVCPSGWTYYNIVPDQPSPATSISGAELTVYMTQHTSAYCCPSDYTMAVSTYVESFPDQLCSRTVSSGGTTVTVTTSVSSTNTTTVLSGKATLVYTPISITWANTDFESMSPRPPEMAPSQFVPTWVPGQSAQLYNKQQAENKQINGLASTVFITVIVVPIVLFLAILGCCICCFRARRRKEKREIEKEREASEAAAAAAATSAAARENDQQDRTEAGIDAARDGGSGQQVGAVANDEGSASSANLLDSSNTGLQMLATEGQAPTAGNATSSLSSITKPHYPGLPSQGFDGIEEPPPYVEARPPVYDTPRNDTTLPTPPPPRDQPEDETHS